MFKHGLETKHYWKTFFHCSLLSFLAGSVNAGGFMACGRFVTHLTGFATLFGIDLAAGSWKAAFGILSVPVYFLIGAMIAAYLVDRRLLQGRTAGYPIVMGMICSCLLGAALGGYWNWFGIFGDGVNLRKDYFLLALLCGASGLQNAAITTYSGSVVRTTHLTGIVTDLGIGLVKRFFVDEKRKMNLREVRVNALRFITLGSYMSGACVGALLFFKIQYLGFLMPATIAAYAMLVTRRSQSNHLPIADISEPTEV